ncbi:phage regulatory CII family protein, partial [Cronobacter sakazakii]
MFDYQTSKHAHFDAACRVFALSHNLEDVAAAVGMRPQILRNKLNPVQ